jgi:hypothetical protein
LLVTGMVRSTLTIPVPFNECLYSLPEFLI